MKRLLLGAVTCGLAVACSGYDGESVQDNAEDLNATYVTSGGPLTKKSYAEPDEASRQQNTLDYYGTVKVVDTVFAAGTNEEFVLGTIATRLNTLSKFRGLYFDFLPGHFPPGSFPVEQTTYYYNRGDLGIGREMHCAESLPYQADQQLNTTNPSSGYIACYVKNFAAGDDQSEFRFGLSQNIAFTNMDAHNEFATVAMVMQLGSRANQKVFFAVYGKDGGLLKAAPLDRSGFNFALGLQDESGTVGTPGVNFNNHIPSNCLNCHGGTYVASTKTVSKALFLPFDLNQFEYESVANRTQSVQAPVFRKQNEYVKHVALLSGSAGNEVVLQTNGWYRNAASLRESLTGDFNPDYVPPGWDTDQARGVYANVVRPSCRGCHMTSQLFPFSSAAGFNTNLVINDLRALAMPHSLQAMREFWQSSKPASLANYFTTVAGASAGAQVLAISPGSVVTLDPPSIMASLVDN